MRNVFALIIAVTASTATVPAQHWPTWRGPTHDGVSTEKNLPDMWSATCAGTADFAAPSPAIGGPSDAAATETVAADAATGEQRGGRQPQPGQNFEGRPIVPTVCANIETKNIAWRLPLPAYSGSSPTIWGDTIFLNVATGSNTGVLELWAIDRNKQAVSWKRPLRSEERRVGKECRSRWGAYE